MIEIIMHHLFAHLSTRICRADIYIPGPGPGNPLSTSNHKITQLRAIIETLYHEKKPFFAECLSHQILSHLLGFPIEKKETPFQGTQETIDLFGKTEVVGFYNTFSAKKTHEIPTIELSFDVTTTDIYALKGPHFFSTQFHPESILTPNGFQIIQDGLLHLLAT